MHDSGIGTSFYLRGNVTTASPPSGTTKRVYDTEGNVVTTIDANGNSTNTNVDVYGNVPSMVAPNGNPYLSTSFQFNDFLGLTSVYNTNGTNASIVYDGYGRPYTSTSPNGAVTHYYYCPDACNSGLSLPATRNGQNYTKITVVNTRWSRDTYDGLGRVIRSERGDTSGNVVSVVDTDYDSCGCSPTGKMWRTSLPYKPGNTAYWTTYTYDGLGRTIAVQAADSASTTAYAYYGNSTVVTDPKGNWKAMTTDVNGNLTSVLEPDPSNPAAAPTSPQSCSSAPSGMLGTCYTYDVLNNLTQVDIYRGGNDQRRSFTYQTGTNWLLTATNPENGTVTYTRDPVGHVTKRVDAASQTTNYTYDGYNRLTQVVRNNDPCQTENYNYDQGIDYSFSSGYSMGKLTAVTFGTGSYGLCPGTAPDSSTWGGLTYDYQYSSAGQVTGKRMQIARTPYYGGRSVVNLDAYWAYDNEGRLNSVTYPVVNDPNTGDPTSTAFTYTYDNMGRPSIMANNLWDHIVDSVVYNANDQMTGINYGDDWVSMMVRESRTYNSMFQMTNISDSFTTNGGVNWQSFSESYTFPTGARITARSLRWWKERGKRSAISTISSSV